jgi:hypothetical protein
MKNVCIFYDHLEYFTAILYNLWPFGTVSGHLVYFSNFCMFGPRKIWQPWTEGSENPLLNVQLTNRILDE